MIHPVSKEVIHALIQSLKDESDIIRIHAAHSLGKIGPEAKDSIPALEKLLEDEGG